MDKKKVKDLVEKAIGVNLNNLVIGDNEHNAPINKANALLNEAIRELSKSDWISVEDRQPPKNEVVLVCNKQEPDDLILAYRTNKETMKIVYPNNIIIYTITHWKPIEKLE